LVVDITLEFRVAFQVTNHLFQESHADYGFDLAALNMQRGRDHGIPSYNDMRDFCGLGRVRSWQELAGIMPNSTVKRYSDLYQYV
jgi:hypothetical protein